MTGPLLSSLRWSILWLASGASLVAASFWLLGRAAPPSESVRSQLTQVLASQSQMLIEKQDWPQLEQLFQRFVTDQPEIRSIGLRDTQGRLLAATRGHRGLWQSAEVQSIGAPLQGDPVPGTMECAFQPPRRDIAHTALGWTAAVFGCGCFAGLGLMFRGTRTSENTVVPDRVRQALDTLAEGLLVMDEQERIVLANRAFAETCAIPPEQLVGRTASSLAWISDDATVRGGFPWVRSLLDNRPLIDQLLQFETREGSRKVFSVNSSPIINASGKRHGALATFRDITEMEEHRAQLENMLVMLRSSRDEISRKNRELEILATQDALTGCLNRRAFFDRFSRAWEHAVKSRTPLACIMVDNDHFKSVNDTYGHHVGDDVLRAVAATLRKMQAPPNLVCRYGGEEFCVLLPCKDYKQALEVAEQIRLSIEAIRFSQPNELRLTASIGVSEIGYGAKDPQELINQADKCLYIAKRSGRNRVVGYLPEMAELEIDESKVSRTKAAEPDSTSIPYPAVSALLSALGYRDAETAEHSRRVADLVVCAAEGLISHHDTYILEIAALLHDVGKVGVPDHILLKEGPLTEDEWDLMRRHQRVGTELVASTFGNAKLEKVIRTYRLPYHPQEANQTPRGEELDVGARLLAIADSFDSMVSDHGYRAAMSQQEAFNELRRCAGKQFDPKLVERFIERVSIRSSSTSPAMSRVVSPQTAIQFGNQLERLADALDHRDVHGLAALASRLRATATQANLPEIVAVAGKLESMAQHDEPLVKMVAVTNELLQLCRSTHTQLSLDFGGPGRPHF